MLSCTFTLELRRVFRMTDPGNIVRGPLLSHCTAIERGSDLAAQIGFTEAKKETQVTQFGGMTRNRIQKRSSWALRQ
jgi:hypothetical protein